MDTETAGLSDMVRTADVLTSKYYFSKRELNRLCISAKNNFDGRINDLSFSAKSYLLNLDEKNPIHLDENGKITYLLACGFKPNEIILNAAYDIESELSVDI